jgi:hypothetical protein
MAPKLGDSEWRCLLVCRELLCQLVLRWSRRDKADNLVLLKLAGSAWWPWVGLELVIESPFQDCSFVVGGLYEIMLENHLGKVEGGNTNLGCSYHR